MAFLFAQTSKTETVPWAASLDLIIAGMCILVVLAGLILDILRRRK